MIQKISSKLIKQEKDLQKGKDTLP